MENINWQDALLIVWFIGFIVTIFVVMFNEVDGRIEYNMRPNDRLLEVCASGIIVVTFWWLFCPIWGILPIITRQKK